MSFQRFILLASVVFAGWSVPAVAHPLRCSNGTAHPNYPPGVSVCNGGTIVATEGIERTYPILVSESTSEICPSPPHLGPDVIQGWSFSLPEGATVEQEELSLNRFLFTVRWTPPIGETSSGYTVPISMTVTDHHGASGSDNCFLKVVPFLEIRAIEHVQVVQDLNNSVPLVGGKETWVRVHVQDRHGSPIPIQATLNELPSDPVLGFSSVDAAAPEIRGGSLNAVSFRIPADQALGNNFHYLYRADQGLWHFADNSPPGLAGTRLDFGSGVTEILVVHFLRVLWWDDDGVAHDPDPSGTNQIFQEMANELLTMFPASKVLWDVELYLYDGDHANSPFPVEDFTAEGNRAKFKSLNRLTSRLDRKRTRDVASGVPEDTIYLGVVEGLSGGLGWLSKRVASAFVDEDKTFAHEIAHSLGLTHPVHSMFGTTSNGGETFKLGPCGNCPPPACDSDPLNLSPREQEPQNVTDFPWIYPNDFNTELYTHVPALGPLDLGNESLMYGWDTNPNRCPAGQAACLERIVSPFRAFDLMGYCSPPNPWVSDETYWNLFGLGVGAGSETRVPGEVRDWLVVRGLIDYEEETVEFLPFDELRTDLEPTPPPEGDFTLYLADENENVLFELPFDPVGVRGSHPLAEDLAAFSLRVEAHPQTHIVAIAYEETPVAITTVSPSAPAVQVVYPNGGEMLDAPEIEISWIASDLDDDPLTFSVEYSSDEGETWFTLITDWHETTYTVAGENLTQTTQGLVRVTASDGVRSGSDTSDAPYTVPNHAPLLFVVTPRQNDQFFGNGSITFRAEAQDLEDGPIETVEWVSSLDGPLPGVTVFSLPADALSVGVHAITATVHDTQGLTTQDTRSIEVFEKSPLLEDLDADGFSETAGDCDDLDPEIHPAAVEQCNGLDDNCDGFVDDSTDTVCADGDVCTTDSCGGASGCLHEITDIDGDYHGDPACGGTDCDDGDPEVWGAPTEISGLEVISRFPTKLSWSDPMIQTGTATVFDLITGDLDAGLAGVPTCDPTGGASIYTDDRPDPVTGSGYWYLVRARNSCGTGSFGSAGRDAAGGNCP